MSVSIYYMQNSHGSSAVAICETHARKAFPRGVGGEAYPVKAEPAETGIQCEFCPVPKPKHQPFNGGIVEL